MCLHGLISSTHRRRLPPSRQHRYPTRTAVWMIFLLLLSGNIHPNPGPELTQLQTPVELKDSSGLRFIHANVRSLIGKIDVIRLWPKLTECDIMVLTETWLKPSTSNDMIHIGGYNAFRSDRVSKGGGVPIFVKNTFNCSLITSLSKPRSLELVAIKLNLPSGAELVVVGCYRPPSALPEASTLLLDSLQNLSDSELILLGDLNWDWLSPSSNALKDICDVVHLTQLIQSPTRLNPKRMDKSTLLDIILTNAPHKYSAVGTFCNDISDHCTVACVRSCKLPKTTSRFIFKRN